jgi:hypothetical protein
MTITAAHPRPPGLAPSFARACWFSRLLLTLVFCAAGAAARAGEPGPEADGVYSCGNSDKKWVYVTDLELKGRTYREFKDGVAPEKRGEFLPFTANDKGEIKWSGRFSFLSHVGKVSSSTYSSSQAPSIMINYSDSKRNPVMMICTQEKSKSESAKAKK